MLKPHPENKKTHLFFLLDVRKSGFKVYKHISLDDVSCGIHKYFRKCISTLVTSRSKRQESDEFQSQTLGYFQEAERETSTSLQSTK
jgi:hypothetical protein